MVTCSLGRRSYSSRYPALHLWLRHGVCAGLFSVAPQRGSLRCQPLTQGSCSRCASRSACGLLPCALWTSCSLKASYTVAWGWPTAGRPTPGTQQPQPVGRVPDRPSDRHVLETETRPTFVSGVARQREPHSGLIRPRPCAAWMVTCSLGRRPSSCRYPGLPLVASPRRLCWAEIAVAPCGAHFATNRSLRDRTHSPPDPSRSVRPPASARSLSRHPAHL